MFFKIIGFALSASTLGVVAYALATSGVHTFLPLIAGLVAVNVLIGFVLPRFIKNNALLNELKSGAHLFALKMNGFVVAIALTIVYIAGVGLTFVFSRIAGKRFMRLKPHTEMWQNVAVKSDLKEMF